MFFDTILTKIRREFKSLFILSLILVSALMAMNGYALVAPGSGLTSVNVGDSLPITDPDSLQWKKTTALEIPLSGQNDVAPIRLKLFTPSLRVKSLNNGSWISFLIEWSDPSINDRTIKTEEFRDSVAIQFTDSDQPFICMGTRDQMVHILHWKADWQADIDEGFQDLEAAFPNFWNDVYPFAIGDPPYRVPENFKGLAKVYLPGWYVGNPFSEPLKVTPVEDAEATGFGSITTQENQDALGRGVWSDSTWKVVITRRMETGDPNDATIRAGAETPIAFAVWDGTSGDRGGRKSVSSWVTLNVDISVLNTPPVASFDFFPSSPKSNEEITFSDRSVDTESEIASWSWNFGDGAKSDERNPVHEYSGEGYFSVTLVVTDSEGGQNTVSRLVKIEKSPPTADFSYSRMSPTVDTDIQFTDKSSDSDGTIVSWDWDFGDDYHSNIQSPTHEYVDPGRYTVTLKVLDDDGQEDTHNIRINVQQIPSLIRTSISLVLFTVIGVILLYLGLSLSEKK
jgi:PKD repeat protein